MGALRLSIIGASLIALSLTIGCSVTTKGSFCQISEPVRLSQSAIDGLTDAEVKRLLTHNRQGQKLCGWKP